LVGTFNAYNLLLVYSIAKSLNVEKLELLRVLSLLESVEGRFQYFKSKNDVTVIVDYAHTPDALENVLNSIKNLRTGNEKLITIVGCGGNRDAEKRPLMSNIACQFSNKVIITSDNPRNEDPNDIIAQMMKGVEPVDFKKTLSLVDRKDAIKTAVMMAESGDIILIAGKGHEKYQEINGVKYPFDDFEIAKELIN
jgi:UDP-N-acetylmuramoyl-L-alanyl-D-glutamate--2,6-diaminopimelate ligase